MWQMYRLELVLIVIAATLYRSGYGLFNAKFITERHRGWVNGSTLTLNNGIRRTQLRRNEAGTKDIGVSGSNSTAVALIILSAVTTVVIFLPIIARLTLQTAVLLSMYPMLMLTRR